MQPSTFNLLDPWEAAWAPYEQATYEAVLSAVRPADIVLDIGAGDLRLARRLACVARRVIAWENQPAVLAQAPRPLPANLEVVCTDARTESPPPGVTVAVLLMRHCTHYGLYVHNLRQAKCRRLITNARWRMGVEVIDLGPGVPFARAGSGWYACRCCGATGFKGGNPAQITAAQIEAVWDTEGCPACTP